MIQKRNVVVNVELFSGAFTHFRRPLQNKVRMSIWPLNATVMDTLPSEWYFDFDIDEIGKLYTVQMMLADYGFEKKLKVGDEIYFGKFPNPIGKGQIVNILIGN